MARALGTGGRVALALALVAGAVGLFQARRSFVRSFFLRGPGGAAAPALPAAADATPLPRAARVRVVVLDGLGLAEARALPGLAAACRDGVDLVADVGFPTVSLPVQTALWSGLTQQQTGIEYVGAKLAAPLDGLPGRVPGAIALAESHGFIVESLGFATTRPAADEVATPAAKAAWEDQGFAAAAGAAVASATPLVLVHVLRIDDAGHTRGVDATYRAAAAWADRALAGWIAAAPDARWLVLADHGHLAAGGHGDADDELRHVRACLFGDVPAALRGATGAVHLVDLSRALADSLGVAPRAGAAGRPLAAALAAPPSDGATLPRPAPWQTAVAIALLLAALGATLAAARLRIWWLPWWAIVAYASVVAIEGVPSLALRMTFAPRGTAVILAALPGLALLAIVGGVATRAAPRRLAITQLALPLAALAAARVLCARTPPLVPTWTAHASFLFVLALSGALVVALALLAGLVPSWFDRSRAAATPPAPP